MLLCINPLDLDCPDALWIRMVVAWYDGAERTAEFNSHTAVWYDTGKSSVPIHWVLIRGPEGWFDP